MYVFILLFSPKSFYSIIIVHNSQRCTGLGWLHSTVGLRGAIVGSFTLYGHGVDVDDVTHKGWQRNEIKLREGKWGELRPPLICSVLNNYEDYIQQSSATTQHDDFDTEVPKFNINGLETRVNTTRATFNSVGAYPDDDDVYAPTCRNCLNK